MDYNNCNKVVPYLAHESDMSRLERTIKRLWVLIVILIATLLLTNLGWIMYESQFEEQVITQENESGYNNYVGNDGDIYNGDNYGETDN